MDKTEVKHFTDLLAWQKGHLLLLNIYKLTEVFPKHEKYGLSSQIQRASVSETSNIAEGYGRYFYKESIKFYYYARGSLAEIENCLIIAKDLKYINPATYETFLSHLTECHKLLNGLINHTKNQAAKQSNN